MSPLASPCLPLSSLVPPLSFPVRRTITEVRASLAPKAPPHALDLVTDTHVYTVVPSTKEEQIAWAVVISRAAGLSGGGSGSTVSKVLAADA